MKGAFYTGQYRNVFAELGHSQEEIDQKLKDAFHTVFYGPDDEKFYLKPAMIWDILKIPVISMPVQRVCRML